MIKDNLNSQIQDALKKGLETRVTTLRMLFTSLTNAEIAKKREALTSEDELKIVKSEAKKREEAAEIYESAGEQKRADKEKEELEILKEFLPKEMGDSELEKIIDEVIKESGVKNINEMGKVIGAIIAKTKGTVDGSRVSQIVKNKLS